MSDFICGCKEFRPACKSAFTLYKVDAQTGQALAGAVFEIENGDCALFSCKSGDCGCVCFPCLDAGQYNIRETIAPPGYLCTEKVTKVHFTGNGDIFLDGRPLRAAVIPNERAME